MEILESVSWVAIGFIRTGLTRNIRQTEKRERESTSFGTRHKWSSGKETTNTNHSLMESKFYFIFCLFLSLSTAEGKVWEWK